MNLQNKILAIYGPDSLGNRWVLLLKGKALDPVPFYEGMRVLALETYEGELLLIDFPTGGLLKIYEDWDDALRAEASLPRPEMSTVEDQVRSFIREHPNNKIQVIKRARELTGMSLKDAKDLVDRLWS